MVLLMLSEALYFGHFLSFYTMQLEPPKIRQKDAPDWSIRGGVEHGPSPRTGSSGGEPGATDWSVRGNGEKTTKRRPGLEHPGRSGARPNLCAMGGGTGVRGGGGRGATRARCFYLSLVA